MNEFSDSDKPAASFCVRLCVCVHVDWLFSLFTFLFSIVCQENCEIFLRKSTFCNMEISLTAQSAVHS